MSETVGLPFSIPLPQRLRPDVSAQSECTTVGDLLRTGSALLSRAGVQNAGNEAAWILEHALGMSRLALHMNAADRLSSERLERACALLHRRARREPLQYLLGAQEFCGLEFEVGPEALIPRPETELLVDAVSRHCALQPSPLIADIGTGSGCIAVALARILPAARVYAGDLSRAALRLARRNAIRHAVDRRVTCLQGDLFEPLVGLGLAGQLHAVVSNPPYIRDADFAMLSPEVVDHEPRLALSGGCDGLKVLGRLIDKAWEFMAPGGLLILEVGHDQAPAVCRIGRQYGAYAGIGTLPDTAGIDRVVVLKKGDLP